jgi:hypothetical protein
VDGFGFELLSVVSDMTEGAELSKLRTSCWKTDLAELDRIQRNFGPCKVQVEEWQSTQLSDSSAKLFLYQAFIEEETGFPRHLARRVHEFYFRPVHQEFQARTITPSLARSKQLVRRS